MGRREFQLIRPLLRSSVIQYRGSTVTTDTFVVKDQANNPWEGRRSLVDDNKTIRFEPHPVPFNTNNTYTLTITKGITDLTGRAMTADKQWRFRTQ
jgi:Bacterial Ig-like domain